MREVNIEEPVSPYRTKVIDKVKSMYHYNDGRKYEGDYSTLFHKWFNDIDDKIIKSAMVFWFMDEDYIGN